MSTLGEELELNLNFKPKDMFSFGIYNNQNIIVDLSGEKSKLIKVIFSSKLPEEKDILYEKLYKMKSFNTLKDFELQEEFISLLFKTNNSEKVELSILLKEISGLLNQLNSQHSCLNCKEAKSTNFYSINQSVTSLCPECRGAILDSIQKIKEQPDNYAMGAVGALVGGLAGSTAWIIIGLLNFYASIAGYAIAFAAFWGYNFFKAKQSKLGIFITISAIVLSILFAEYVGIMIDLLREYPELDIKGFISITPQLFADQEFLSSVLPNLGLGLLFAGLGSFRLIKTMIVKSHDNSSISLEAL